MPARKSEPSKRSKPTKRSKHYGGLEGEVALLDLGNPDTEDLKAKWTPAIGAIVDDCTGRINAFNNAKLEGNLEDAQNELISFVNETYNNLERTVINILDINPCDDSMNIPLLGMFAAMKVLTEEFPKALKTMPKSSVVLEQLNGGRRRKRGGARYAGGAPEAAAAAAAPEATAAAAAAPAPAKESDASQALAAAPVRRGRTWLNVTLSVSLMAILLYMCWMLQTHRITDPSKGYGSRAFGMKFNECSKPDYKNVRQFVKDKVAVQIKTNTWTGPTKGWHEAMEEENMAYECLDMNASYIFAIKYMLYLLTIICALVPHMLTLNQEHLFQAMGVALRVWGDERRIAAINRATEVGSNASWWAQAVSYGGALVSMGGAVAAAAYGEYAPAAALANGGLSAVAKAQELSAKDAAARANAAQEVSDIRGRRIVAELNKALELNLPAPTPLKKIVAPTHVADALKGVGSQLQVVGDKLEESKEKRKVAAAAAAKEAKEAAAEARTEAKEAAVEAQKAKEILRNARQEKKKQAQDDADRAQAAADKAHAAAIAAEDRARLLQKEEATEARAAEDRVRGIQKEDRTEAQAAKDAAAEEAERLADKAEAAADKARAEEANERTKRAEQVKAQQAEQLANKALKAKSFFNNQQEKIKLDNARLELQKAQIAVTQAMSDANRAKSDAEKARDDARKAAATATKAEEDARKAAADADAAEAAAAATSLMNIRVAQGGGRKKEKKAKDTKEKKLKDTKEKKLKDLKEKKVKDTKEKKVRKVK